MQVCEMLRDKEEGIEDAFGFSPFTAQRDMKRGSVFK